MLNPFVMFGRLFLAFFRIAGYALGYGLQALWHLRKGDRSHVGHAIGGFGHAVTDALADVFTGRR